MHLRLTYLLSIMHGIAGCSLWREWKSMEKQVGPESLSVVSAIEGCPLCRVTGVPL